LRPAPLATALRLPAATLTAALAGPVAARVARARAASAARLRIVRRAIALIRAGAPRTPFAAVRIAGARLRPALVARARLRSGANLLATHCIPLAAAAAALVPLRAAIFRVVHLALALLGARAPLAPGAVRRVARPSLRAALRARTRSDAWALLECADVPLATSAANLRALPGRAGFHGVRRAGPFAFARAPLRPLAVLTGSPLRAAVAAALRRGSVTALAFALAPLAVGAAHARAPVLACALGVFCANAAARARTPLRPDPAPTRARSRPAHPAALSCRW
jgi:hypothetical protein